MVSISRYDCRGQGCKDIVPGAMLIEVGRILTTGFGSTADFEAIVRRSLRLAEATALQGSNGSEKNIRFGQLKNFGESTHAAYPWMPSQGTANNAQQT